MFRMIGSIKMHVNFILYDLALFDDDSTLHRTYCGLKNIVAN